MINNLTNLRKNLIDIHGSYIIPIRGCDYYFKIYDNETLTDPLCEELIVTGFKIPLNDITFNSSAESAYLLTPSIQVQPMSFEYVTFDDDIINDLYLNQYDKGLLKIRSKTDRPRIDIYVNKGLHSIISIMGCTFSYPRPEVSLESTKLSKFSVDVNFCELKLN